MSNTYTDATGVLLFDGPARITPVIAMLFNPFKLDTANNGDDNQRYIAVLSEESNPDWDNYLDDLIDSMPEPAQVELANLSEPSEVLLAIGRHFGADLKDFSTHQNFDESVRIAEVVRLARLLQDGHNLVGLSMEGAWHGDRPRLWEFGGWAIHVTPHYTIELSSSDVTAFGRALDAALLKDAATAAGVVDQWLDRFIDGIEDRSHRETLRLRYASPEEDPYSSESRLENESTSLIEPFTVPATAPLSDATYVAFGGTRCPFCGSTEIEAPGGCEVDAGIATQLIVCHDCNGEWTDQYQLTGYQADSQRPDRH